MGLLAILILSASASAFGTVWTWGVNRQGEIGDGTSTGPNTCSGTASGPCATAPASVLNASTGIAGGFEHSLAVRLGRAVAWGDNRFGELGDGTNTGPSLCAKFACSTKPVFVIGLPKRLRVVQVAGGVNFSLALMSNGTVEAWGENEFGQLGDGTFTGPSSCKVATRVWACSTTPVQVSGLSNVIAIAAGGNHALALLSNHTVMAWGANDAGQLGQLTSSGPQVCFVTTPCSTTPVLVKSATGNALLKVDAIAAGDAFSLAMFTNVTHPQIYAWGYNAFGQLGNGTTSGPNTCFHSEPCGLAPTVIRSLIEVRAIAASANAAQALAILYNGSVAAWGDNEFGQVGNGCSTPFCPTPMLEGGITDATAIATSVGVNMGRSMALLGNGQAVEWGTAPLGDGNANGPSSCLIGSCSLDPVNVKGMSAASAIAVGGEQSLAIAPPPANKFSLVLAPCRVCQAITLKVKVPAPGLLTALQAPVPHHGSSGGPPPKPLINPVTITVTRAGTVKIKLRLTRAGQNALKHKHSLKVKTLITYTPTGGTPASKTVTVTLKREPQP